MQQMFYEVQSFAEDNMIVDIYCNIVLLYIKLAANQALVEPVCAIVYACKHVVMNILSKVE